MTKMRYDKINQQSKIWRSGAEKFDLPRIPKDKGRSKRYEDGDAPKTPITRGANSGEKVKSSQMHSVVMSVLNRCKRPALAALRCLDGCA